MKSQIFFGDSVKPTTCKVSMHVKQARKNSFSCGINDARSGRNSYISLFDLLNPPILDKNETILERCSTCTIDNLPISYEYYTLPVTINYLRARRERNSERKARRLQ